MTTSKNDTPDEFDAQDVDVEETDVIPEGTPQVQKEGGLPGELRDPADAEPDQSEQPTQRSTPKQRKP